MFRASGFGSGGVVPSVPALLVALVVTSAMSSAASVDLSTTEPLALEGTVEVEMPEGRFRLSQRGFTGAALFTLTNASAIYWEREETAYGGVEGTPPIYPASGDPRPTPIELAPGTATMARFDDETAVVTVLANTTALFRVVPAAFAPGSPVVAPPGGSQPSLVVPDPGAKPLPNVPIWRCPAGWWVQGTLDPGVAMSAGEDQVRGGPAAGTSNVSMTGKLRIGIFTGNVTLTGRDGDVHTFRAGRHAIESGATAATQRERSSAVFIDGDGTFTLNEASDWASCSEHQSIAVAGRSSWTNANGDATDENSTRRFDAARVEARGAFVIVPFATAGAFDQYTGSGDANLFINGVALAQAPAVVRGPPRLSWIAAAIVVLGFAAKFGLGLYTRLAASELLAHPRRRLIHDTVVASPGIHKRELHRKVGGAWGPFTFHLGMLEKGGYLRIDTSTAYAQVFARDGKGPPGPVIPHPVPRAIYDALPADGSPMPFQTLRTVLKLTPQLLNYHMTALSSRGLVRVEGRAFGPKAAARVRQEGSTSAPLER